MTNFEKMKPLLPDVGISLAAKVLAESPGRCNFCAYGKIPGRKCRGGDCKDGIREWLESEAEEYG